MNFNDPRIGKLSPKDAQFLKDFAADRGMIMPVWMAKEIEEKTDKEPLFHSIPSPEEYNILITCDGKGKEEKQKALNKLLKYINDLEKDVTRLQNDVLNKEEDVKKLIKALFKAHFCMYCDLQEEYTNENSDFRKAEEEGKGSEWAAAQWPGTHGKVYNTLTEMIEKYDIKNGDLIHD